MNTEIKNLILLASAFLVLFGIAELLYRKWHVKAEYTRKLVHIGTGLLTMLFPIMLTNHWSVLFLCASFLIILLMSLRYKFLQGINNIDRVSYGSISYPVIVFICYLVWENLEKSPPGDSSSFTFFYLPILIMAFADPAAALVGKRWPVGVFKWGNEKKSLAGSLAFFIVAFVLCLIFFINASAYSIGIILLFSVLIALTAAITEVVSKKGFDNLTIPLSVLILLYLLIIV